MTAEYYSGGDTCKEIIHYRQLSADLGWAVAEPTVLYLDNKTAIALATAPQISRKSRHVFVKHHFVRELVANKVIRIVYVPSRRMSANILTNFLPCNQFLVERDLLFNRAAMPSPVSQVV